MEPALPRRVRIAASTSNLGPGFDLLGVALTPALEVEVTARASEQRFAELAGEALAWPARDNLFLRAFELAHGALPRGTGFEFAVRSEIPLERGLGSSAAAIAAGLLLGDALAEPGPRTRRSRAELFELGLPLEGHPDNLAPALFGGARMCVPRAGGAAHVLAVDVHPSIGWALAWPEVRMPTAAARAALPRSVPFADAVENPRRLALLLAGLSTADPELLADGIQDCLHVEHRLALIPGARAVLAAARDAGAWAATLSGSGSAHVALGPRERCAAIAEAMARAWRDLKGAGTGRAVEIVAAPPEVS
jgi:homoserine kinase